MTKQTIDHHTNGATQIPAPWPARRKLLAGLGATVIAPFLANCADRSNRTEIERKEAAMANTPDFAEFARTRTFVETPYGRIAAYEAGLGPAAVFLHGLGINAYHWRYQLTDLADVRRCIGIDLMAFGHTKIAADQDVSFTAQADMILATMDKMGINKFDLVGSDSGGGIAQIVAAIAPQRIRSLVLTNCDVHDNWPPAAVGNLHKAAVAGQLGDIFAGFVAKPEKMRAPGGLAHAVYENAEHLTDELVRIYLGPPTATPERRDAVNRFLASQDPTQLVQIEDQLRRLQVPSLILWATKDIFFGLEWAYWLRDTIPGAKEVVEFDGAKLFFAEERPDEVTRQIRRHWAGVEVG